MAEQVIGVREIVQKLERLDRRMSSRLVTSALRRSTTSTQRQMRAAAPVGKAMHKTYKGRLVAPGFLKRSIKRGIKTDKRTGNKYLLFGVRREAWYAKFYAEGPYTITQRRYKGKGTRSVKAYTLRRVPFFSEVFKRDSDNIASRFLKLLGEAASKV